MENSSVFEFTSYKLDPKKKRAVFYYTVFIKGQNPVLFSESIVFPKSFKLKGISQEAVKKTLQGVHLALGISYYKLHCASKIKLNYLLCKEEAEFWGVFYKKGLGEFFYRNKLDPKISPKFPFDKKQKFENYRIQRNNKFLVGVAGGKDSIVSGELMKKYGADFTAIFFETQKKSEIVDNVINEIGADSMRIRRYLDNKIFNKDAGYYSGHIPVSGIYAFLGILTAMVYGYSFFVVSNEFSSNFGNVRYKGSVVNHQWSKSFEFEESFQNYVKKFITPDIFYFSLLRPFYEIRIAELFAKYEKYFNIFSSCNNSFKINPQADQEGGSNKLWCGHCAKCAFVFLILSPFLSKETLINIFGSNLFENSDIVILLCDILGFGKSKPFDCVGTDDESRAAFYMARDKFRNDLAGEIFLPKIDPEDNRYYFNEKKILLRIYFQGKIKPQELINKVFKTQPSNVPDYLKFLGMANALIVGYGQEGKVSEEYLKLKYPDLKVGVADMQTDPDYLSSQANYDIAVKSPGVSKEAMKIPYTTATNIFFSYVKQIPGVKIIGVTGTKGKSTTASLIYHILKKSGKNVQLLGNIGMPMLSALSQEIKKNTIFVLELSSYQLSDIKYSPDIAVVTSLFPEHMDYHSTLKNYYAAKKNILKFQEKEDVFVFDPKNKRALGWANEEATKAKKVFFAGDDFLNNIVIPLIGTHNKDNVRAAVAVAEELGIFDKKIKSGIETFTPLPHRLEFVGKFNDINFYDDAISTTPESTVEAIKSLESVDTIFLGGEERGYNFKQLEKVIKRYKIRNVVLFPETGEKINVDGLNILKTESMEDAVRFAYRFTMPGKICLLSCASPSYSLWKNFEEKGEQFQESIKKMANEKEF